VRKSVHSFAKNKERFAHATEQLGHEQIFYVIISIFHVIL